MLSVLTRHSRELSHTGGHHDCVWVLTDLEKDIFGRQVEEAGETSPHSQKKEPV